MILDKKKAKSENGFTLLEVTFSMVILAIGLLAIAALQMVAIRGNAFGHHLSEATERIETQIELYRSMPYTEIESLAEGDAVQDEEGYTLWSVVQEGSPHPDGTKKVTVFVSWTDNSGLKNHQIQFETLVAATDANL